MSDNPIPGYAVLGWGFDIFKTYSTASKTEQLFAMPAGTETWTSGAMHYTVPANVVVESLGDTQVDSRVFSSREQVQEYFEGRANIDASYGAFSGQFEASYQNRAISDQEYMYALYDSHFYSWRLNLQNQTASALAPWVTESPDWQDVPTTFDASTSSTFYNFFQKYGTHYVAAVKVGYQFYFYQAVQRKYESNDTTIKANIDLEYKAAFVDTKAECSATWTALGQTWTEQTITSIEAHGGDSSPLEAVLPMYQSNYHDTIAAWRKTAEAAPTGIDFDLRPIWVLFSGAQATALQQAFESYQRDRVYVESKSDDSSILVGGVPETPPPPPLNTVGLQICVLDRLTLAPLINEYVPLSVVYWTNTIDAYYERAYSLVAPYSAPEKYLVIVTSFSMVGLWFPRGSFYEYLLSIGADDALHEWQLVGQGNSDRTVGVNYALVGVSGRGPGTGAEAVSIGDTPARWDELVDLEFAIPGAVHVEAPAAGLDVILERFQKSTNPRLARTNSTNLLQGDRS